MRTEDLIHFCAPGRLIIGNGTRHQLPQLLARLGYRSGVLVTDAFFVEKTPWVHEYTEAAGRLGIATLVYPGGLPDPTTQLCDEATAILRQQLGGEQPDHVIALGGGSNIDLAKALSLTLPQGQPIGAFTGDIGGCRPLPLIALPTTSGTGSEATPGAILLDPANATKIAVMDNALRPQIALIDPEFTYTCPPKVTADAGIDAFTHAIESFLTLDCARFDRGGSPDPGYSGRSALTMLFAKESMRLCFAWMERAYQHGGDTEARVGMAYASIYAALSYGTAGLNAGHGIAYAVAGQTHKSHGSTNAVMLPYVLDALCGTRQSELAEVAGLMGLATSCPDESARRVPVAVRAMIGRLDIPTDLRAFGVEERMLDALVTDALAVTRLAEAFPVADAALAYRQIVLNAWEGRLSGQA
ncbi:iron-containing alcohol dehydrogenase [Pseudomonas lopnurensis]|uniref:iron-containing alcohol dehydrogenase n=1 Tax=Pseudomonas lopnurensis TaxID=1477517 RepID=UPI00187A60B0|nr:iron-containing alcohol dehydrogenase [Pseudomonas lopnurensis]MBE7373361.1 iron-containing alcohol dehydrogenase [Pseudomonas lopnurensis]